jgi:D-amino-acid dehydrogenase
VIGESRHHARVFYAFGHGHLGLTQAATTGRLIVERLLGEKTTVDLTPFRIGRFRNRED